MSTNTPRLLKPNVNVSTKGSFVRNDAGDYALDEFGTRTISYYKDNIIEKFPQLYDPTLLDASLEMNLYLTQRASGEYSRYRNKKKISELVWSTGYIASQKGEPLNIKTISSIAKDLKLFLDFISQNNWSYLDIIAVPIKESDREFLPIWQYQRKLCERVKSQDLGFKTAVRMLSRVRGFYVWSFMRGKIGQLPFDMKLTSIKKKKNDDYDILYAMPNKENVKEGLQVCVSDLTIPKTIKQKAKSQKGLRPYSASELNLLLDTDTAKHRTYGLLLKCAYLGGLRSFETIQIDYSDLKDPSKNSERAFYQIGLVRKHNMPKPINITRSLMQSLWDYTLDETWKKRRLKHEILFGKDNKNEPLPLFINSQGKRMAETAASDTINMVRKELKSKGSEVNLERDYHDLRATFGTRLAVAAMDAGTPEKRVKAILRKWMGHEDFNTTELYLNFATVSPTSEFGVMHEWVNDIYKEVRAIQDEELKDESNAS